MHVTSAVAARLTSSLACAALALASGARAGPEAATPLFPIELQHHLGLSAEQQRLSVNLIEHFRTASAVRDAGLTRLRQQLSVEQSRPVPDPATLGATQAAIEALKREWRIDRLSLSAALVGVLSESQRKRLAALKTADRLAQAGREARCSGFLADMNWDPETDVACQPPPGKPVQEFRM